MVEMKALLRAATLVVDLAATLALPKAVCLVEKLAFEKENRMVDL